MPGDQPARILDACAPLHPAFAEVAELREQPHEQADPQRHADDAGTVADRRDPRRHPRRGAVAEARSEEHTSELQSLMSISSAVFCMKKKRNHSDRRTNRRKSKTKRY